MVRMLRPYLSNACLPLECCVNFPLILPTFLQATPTQGAYLSNFVSSGRDDDTDPMEDETSDSFDRYFQSLNTILPYDFYLSFDRLLEWRKMQFLLLFI